MRVDAPGPEQLRPDAQRPRGRRATSSAGATRRTAGATSSRSRRRAARRWRAPSARWRRSRTRSSARSTPEEREVLRGLLGPRAGGRAGRYGLRLRALAGALVADLGEVLGTSLVEVHGGLAVRRVAEACAERGEGACSWEILGGGEESAPVLIGRTRRDSNKLVTVQMPANNDKPVIAGHTCDSDRPGPARRRAVDAELAAAVSDAGGLGFLAAGYLTRGRAGRADRAHARADRPPVRREPVRARAGRRRRTTYAAYVERARGRGPGGRRAAGRRRRLGRQARAARAPSRSRSSRSRSAARRRTCSRACGRRAPRRG